MIKSLNIRNYALIESLDIDIYQGLNIITGETGAGKSILLGSLELLMGKRADYSVLLDKDKKCIVEAVFDIKDYNLKDFFIKNEIEYDTEVIIRRIVSPTGKSRAFINDEPVNLNILKELTANLIQMHRQFDNLEINNPAYQLKLIDEFGDLTALKEKYSIKYKEYTENKKELERLIEEDNAFKKEMDFLKFQYEELSNAELSQEEFEEMEDMYGNLSNAETIKSTLQMAFDALVEGEFSILNRLDPVLFELNNLEIKSKDFDESKEKLLDAVENLRESANTFLNIAENTDYDEAKIEEIKNRLDLLNSLMVKYKVDSIDELISIRDDLESQLKRHFDVDEKISQLKKQLESDNKNLLKLAQEMSNKRQKAAKRFSDSVYDILKELALPYAGLKVEFDKYEDLTTTGLDKIKFLFRANKGSDFKPVKDVASGGELSRLALAIETTIADKMALPTLIFDEIEAGISGEVARKMGAILHQLSIRHQLINITHSPQIAAEADHHFFVYKYISGDKTKTGIKLLSKEERIIELAKILSGDPPSDSAIKNARELINKN